MAPDGHLWSRVHERAPRLPWGFSGLLRIASRHVVEDVVAGALKLSEEFERLAADVERIEQRSLLGDEQVRFAEKPLALRFPDLTLAGMQPSQLLESRP